MIQHQRPSVYPFDTNMHFLHIPSHSNISFDSLELHMYAQISYIHSHEPWRSDVSEFIFQPYLYLVVLLPTHETCVAKFFVD